VGSAGKPWLALVGSPTIIAAVLLKKQKNHRRASGVLPESWLQARKQAQAYFRLYHEHIPVAQLVREVAAVMQEYTREAGCEAVLNIV
jgi:hypothetical protein